MQRTVLEMGRIHAGCVLVSVLSLASAGMASPCCDTADTAVSVAATPEPAVAGGPVGYQVSVRNLGPDPAPGAQLQIQLDPSLGGAVTTGCAEDPAGVPTCSLGDLGAPRVFRVTEKPIHPGQFTGGTFNLQLDADLAPDYFVLIQGSGFEDDDERDDEPSDTSPAVDFARLTGDPWGTGDLAASGAPDRLMLKRGSGMGIWTGVVTVVECLADCDANGFRLLTVAEVVHPASDGAVSGSHVVSVPWGDAERVLLPGGPNGAGCATTDTDPDDHPVCHTRLEPTGAGTIEWTRDTAGADLGAGATTTVPVVRWGTAWTVQRRRVQTDAGADGADTPAAYGTAAITPVDRAATWVWGCGHTAGKDGGTAADAVLVTLGDGVAVDPVEDAVAVGSEHAGFDLDLEVWTLSHPDAAVDHVFKADGDAGALAVPVTVAPAGPGARMALAFNGLESTSGGYPQPLLAPAYTSDDEITLVRRRAGAAFPAWVQGVDLSAIRGAGSAREVVVSATVPADAPSLVTTTVTVGSSATDPDPSNNTAVANTAVVQVSDLAVSLADDLDPVIAGRTITYAATVTGTGPSDATGTVVSTVLDPRLTLVATGGCAEDPVGSPVCTLGTVPAGGAAGFTLQATTDPDARGAVTVRATVTSDADDPAPANDLALEVTRLTDEIPVGDGGAPAVSGDLGGTSRLVVAWETGAARERADGVRARLFSADGMPVGVEIDVSDGGGAARGEPDVAFVEGGELVVAWQEDGADGDGSGIRARRFDASGMPVGVEYPVNAGTDNDQTAPAVGAAGSGTVVTWADEVSPGSYRRSVRLFDASGMPVGVELEFGTADVEATPPAIAVSPTGEFLVTWESATDRIAGQLFDASGMPVGVELEIDSGAGTAAGFPAVAWHPSGTWLVAWQADADGDANGIFARFLDASGMPVGVELQLNADSAGDQTRPDLSVDGAGEFAVTWQTGDADGERILARLFDASGMPVGVELQVDESPGSVSSRPAVAHVADGEYWVAWQDLDSDGDGSDEVVGGRSPLVFADGFEAGDVGAWSGTTP